MEIQQKLMVARYVIEMEVVYNVGVVYLLIMEVEFAKQITIYKEIQFGHMYIFWLDLVVY